MLNFRSVALYSLCVCVVGAAAVAETPDRSSLVYQDWVMNCVSQKASPAQPAAPADKKTEPAKDITTCEILQTFRVRTNNATVANLALGKVAPGAERKFVAQVPVGVSLPESISLEVDKKPTVQGQYLRCTPTVCLAQFDAKKDLLDALKAGTDINLVFADTTGTKVKLPLSSKGFGDALAALDQRAP